MRIPGHVNSDSGAMGRNTKRGLGVASSHGTRSRDHVIEALVPRRAFGVRCTHYSQFLLLQSRFRYFSLLRSSTSEPMNPHEFHASPLTTFLNTPTASERL
jgi:hypothetical protein